MAKEARICRCGCGLQFDVNPTSRKQYLNDKHRFQAKDQRRKFRLAGVEPDPATEEVPPFLKPKTAPLSSPLPEL